MSTTRTHPRRVTRGRAPATRAATRAATAARRRRARQVGHRRRWVGWTIASAVAAAAIALVLVGGNTPAHTAGGTAPGFTLASTRGEAVSLADHQGHDVLLYFNEGAGCDICFYQTAQLEADPAFRDLSITFVPVVMNPVETVRAELERFGITTPYLSDPDGSTSRAYETLGTGHHADLPGHSFILVGPDGRIAWRGDYPGMWVEPAELVDAITPELAP